MSLPAIPPDPPVDKPFGRVCGQYTTEGPCPFPPGHARARADQRERLIPRLTNRASCTDDGQPYGPSNPVVVCPFYDYEIVLPDGSDETVQADYLAAHWAQAGHPGPVPTPTI